MRRRSTFIPSHGVDYDPSELSIQDQHLSFAGLKAAREERLTFGLSELPTEIREVLARSHELHIRWVSEEPYIRSGPYLSTLPPGLHLQYTPLHETQDDEGLCQILRQIFSPSLRCSSPKTSFSQPQLTSDRFASTASSQYYSLLSSFQRAVAWLQRNVCSQTDVICMHNAALLNIASYVDLDYDALSSALTLTAYWSKPPPILMDPVGEWTTYDHWNLAIDASPSDRNEVGILRLADTLSPAAEPNDIGIEGFLTVIGQDEEPKPTIFNFPSRHHAVSAQQAKTQQYRVAFDQPSGLHPTMRISFTSASSSSSSKPILTLTPPTNKPEGSTCALHTYMTLPSVLFPDEYAFPSHTPDPLFTKAHNILSLRSLSGEKDLEAPDYAINKWGSAMLLELATPSSTNASSQSNYGSWDITIPLHLRYLPPTTSGYAPIQIPHPIVFWACTAEEGTKFAVNPFDRVNLGYDGLFGPRTMFYHLESAAEQTRLVTELNVPVLKSSMLGFGMIELLTGLLVLGGFVYVAVKVVLQIGKDGKGSTHLRHGNVKKTQ